MRGIQWTDKNLKIIRPRPRDHTLGRLWTCSFNWLTFWASKPPRGLKVLKFLRIGTEILLVNAFGVPCSRPDSDWKSGHQNTIPNKSLMSFWILGMISNALAGTHACHMNSEHSCFLVLHSSLGGESSFNLPASNYSVSQAHPWLKKSSFVHWSWISWASPAQKTWGPSAIWSWTLLMLISSQKPQISEKILEGGELPASARFLPTTKNHKECHCIVQLRRKVCPHIYGVYWVDTNKDGIDSVCGYTLNDSE